MSDRSYTYKETMMGRARIVVVGRKFNEMFSRVGERVGGGGGGGYRRFGATNEINLGVPVVA